MDIDDLLRSECMDTITPQITPGMFIISGRIVLKEIDQAYGSCWKNRPLTPEETLISPCDGCKGCGQFKINGEEIDCVADHEAGECYVRYFDSDEFAEIMQDEIIFGDRFQELLTSDVIGFDRYESNQK